MRSGGVPIEMTVLRMYNAGSKAIDSTMRQLATGLQINRGADDPAGLISSEVLRSSLAALDAETRSLQRADAVASTADGALGEVSELLGEAESLAVAAANTGGMSAQEREALQLELDSILQTVDRVAGSSFAGRKLFDGSMELRVGDDGINLNRLSARELGLSDLDAGGAMNLVSGDAAGAAAALRAAREKVSTQRGSLGSFQKDALAPRLRAIDIAAENTAAAVSVIRDTDYAAATSELARQQVLLGAAGSMLRVSSSNNQTVLDLLGSPRG